MIWGTIVGLAIIVGCIVLMLSNSRRGGEEFPPDGGTEMLR